MARAARCRPRAGFRMPGLATGSPQARGPAADRRRSPRAGEPAGRQRTGGNPRHPAGRDRGVAARSARAPTARRPTRRAAPPTICLRMVHGQPVAPVMAEALDTLFRRVIDNGLNTSAFTARVVASSGASLVSAALGAYCAFTGPLHGGAPGPTLDMLDEAEASGDVADWAERKLAAGERLMGFGHRVFRLGDPRAALLRARSKSMGETPRPRCRPARLCRRGRTRGRRRLRPAEAGPAAAAAECRDQRGAVARRGRLPARRVHAGFRGGALRRLARARDGTAQGGTADPPVLGLCRTGARGRHAVKPGRRSPDQSSAQR